MEINNHISSSKLDIPFLVMGLLFVAMALAEYLFPEGSGGTRLAIKILSGVQIVFALIIAFFTRRSAIFSRWIPVSFFVLFLWLCISGIIHSDNLRDTLYLCVIFFYWYSLFLFFYTRSRIHPDRLQVFLIFSVSSLLIWIPALINSTEVIMASSDLPKGQFRQNYIGYYIVALFPYVLMLKKRSLKIIAIALISFGSLYSLKRGAVLALVLMGLGSSFFYVTVVSSIRKRGRKVIALFFLWGIVIVVGGLFAYANPEAVKRRLNENTNRGPVYGRILDVIQKSEFYELVIGHGDQKAHSKIGDFTHNDWLMLIFDYGIISVILMINIYVSLVWLLWKLCKLKSPLSLPLVSAFILMTCVQQYSMGLQLKTFGFITGSIGLVVGSFYAEYSSQSKVICGRKINV